MTRIIIADDEPSARAKLRRLLNAEPGVELVAECANGRTAREAIAAFAPDIVFVDIQMPEMDGFSAIAGAHAVRPPAIVFVTAYDEYAVRAFDVQACDYLLKPFGAVRLRAALERAKQAVASARTAEPTAVSAVWLERVVIRSLGRVDVVDLANVEWMKGEGNYVRLHGVPGRPLLRETLARLAQQLNPERFARIHRSAIVSLQAIREMRASASGDRIVTLASGTKVRLSRSYRAALDARLDTRRQTPR